MQEGGEDAVDGLAHLGRGVHDNHADALVNGMAEVHADLRTPIEPACGNQGQEQSEPCLAKINVVGESVSVCLGDHGHPFGAGV